MQHLKKYFARYPVICGVRNNEDLQYALSTPQHALVFLTGDIFSLETLIPKAKESGKLVFLHTELVKGISQDIVGIRYLAQRLKVDGIITTKSHVVKFGKEENLLTIQRFFIVDSTSLEKGIAVVKKAKPNAVEVLPGILTKDYLNYLNKEINLPVIAGGLIRDLEEVKEILKSGVMAVSTSKKELWSINLKYK